MNRQDGTATHGKIHQIKNNSDGIKKMKNSDGIKKMINDQES